MADDDNISVGFSIGDRNLNGEINHGFFIDEGVRKEDLSVSLPNGHEDDRESDYYSGSPVDSLKNVDDETDGISETGRASHGRSRSGTQTSLRSRTSCKTVLKSSTHKIRMKLESQQKWRDLTMGTSFVLAICLSIIYLALLISEVLPTETVNPRTLLGFLVVMFSLSILAIGFLLTLSVLGKVTNDDHYKKRGKSTFIRGGMLVLGTGMIIFSSLTVATFIHADAKCRSSIALVSCILSIVFTVGQIAFLLIYNKVRINRSLPLSIVGRYLMMTVIATNLCVWLGAVFHETVEEIRSHSGDEHSESFFGVEGWHGSVQMALPYALEKPAGGENFTCNATDLRITYILTPYLFPLMIEFCVMASCMCLAVWENCGNGWLKLPNLEPEENAISSRATTSADNDSVFAITETESISPSKEPTKGHQPSHYFNSNIGFVFGWVVIVGTVVIIILVLYYLYSNTNADIKESMMYGLNLALSAVCLIAVPFTMYSMSKLTFKDDEIRALRIHNHEHSGLNAPSAFKGIHRKTDKSLLFNTYIAMMTFKLFVMIAAYQMGEPVIFIDGIISILFGFFQTLFINWYAFKKRATTEEDRKDKPGRQGLEFLRCTNFALWLVNTFLLKNFEAKRVMYETFGSDAWALLSNILQPLTILYYFHAMVCLAEVIGHAYTAKYVGVTRPWKMPKVRQKKISKSRSSNSLTKGSLSPGAEFTEF